MRKFGGCLTMGLALLCAPVVFTAIGKILEGENAGAFTGLAVMFGGMSIGLAWAAMKLFKAPKPRGETPAQVAHRERTILQLAAHHGGALTVPQLCAGSNMTLAQAEYALDQMHTQRAAELEVDEDGAQIYRFVGLLGPRSS